MSDEQAELVDAQVYDERGNVRPVGTPGARPMTYAERVEIAAALGSPQAQARIDDPDDDLDDPVQTAVENDVETEPETPAESAQAESDPEPATPSKRGRK